MRDAGWQQLPMFAPPIRWRAPDLSSLPSWEGAKRVCVDIECRDDTLSALGIGVRRGGYMVGIGFAIEDGPDAYLPIAHEGGGNLDKEAVLAYLRQQASVFTGQIVGAGLQFDLDYLWEAGIDFKRTARHADVQLAECLLDELQDDYSLDAILKRRGLPGKDEGELAAHADAWGLHRKKQLWRLPAGAVGPYVQRDTRGPLELLRKQELELVDQELGRAWDTECAVLPALVRMTRRGIRVNVDELEAISAWAQSIVANELGRVAHATGVRATSPANANQLAPALQALGYQVPRQPFRTSEKTGKEIGGGYSITNEWLTGLKHPVADAIVRAREFAKLDGTYCKGVRRHLIGDRLHPSFKQLRGGADDEDEDDEGARWGRMACRHPNAQAQPIRNEEYGPRWRGIYLAEDGEQFACNDYSQQEPRTTVHYAEICKLQGAAEFGERYRNDPSTDCHGMFAEISGLPRKRAKNVFLGLCYGMGGGLLADSLGLPTAVKRRRDGTEYVSAGPEAQSVLDQFDQRVPFVRALARMCTREAERKGWIKLIDGRRVRFPRDAHGNFDWTYKALNRLIQGSAAIQTKNALVLLDRAGHEPRLAVHDEFDFSIATEAVAREAAAIMAAALPLSVPSHVEVKIGSSYGDIKVAA